MTPSLAIAYDEFGLRSLIDGFISRVHHHPDPQTVRRYRPSTLAGNTARIYIDPGPARLMSREAEPGQPRRERLTFRLPLLGDCSLARLTVHAHWAAAAARHTVIVLHGGLVGTAPGGSDLRPYERWCQEANKLGLHALFVELPYHLSRTPPGFFSGELFVSGDLVRTLNSICLAVAEVRALLGWLEAERLPTAGLLAFSLGGLVAAQVLGVDDRLRFAALMAPVPEPFRTFDATLIGSALSSDWSLPGLTREHLRMIFDHVRPASFEPTVQPEDLQLFAARWDQTVELEDMQALQEAWGCRMSTFDVGHFALPTERHLVKQHLLPFLSRYA